MQPGSSATFYITSFNVGVMKSCDVRTEKGSEATEWGLGSMEVYNSATAR